MAKKWIPSKEIQFELDDLRRMLEENESQQEELRSMARSIQISIDECESALEESLEEEEAN